MKKWFLVFSICLSSLIDAIDPAALAQLASALDIPEDENIVVATQKRWLRKPGLERWEMTELPPDQRSLVLNWATEQGMFSPWKPLYKIYDKAFILAATTSPMQKRLDYLKQLWEEGVRFKEIVWLTGDRPLDSRVDGLTDRCSTESEAARLIWKEADLPADLRAVPVVFVAAPMKRNGASEYRRYDSCLARNGL